LNARFVHKPKIRYRPIFIAGFLCAVVVVVTLIILLATPAVSSAATWVGCQLDNSYRFSGRDPGALKKPECGGRPRNEELDKWKNKPRSSLPAEGPGANWQPWPVILYAAAPESLVPSETQNLGYRS